MAKVEFKLDHGGVAALLRSGQFKPAVSALAERIAANIPGATVEMRTTDRTNALIRVKDGARRQAKDGTISRAAASAGTSVRSKR